MNDEDAIQEKFYPPRFIQVPENMSIEEGRFCRMDFKVSFNILEENEQRDTKFLKMFSSSS